MNDQQRIELISEHIGTFPEFPKEGVLFKDIFTALRNGIVCGELKNLLVNFIRKNYPDVNVIIGLESRGFLFSLMIAAELGIGCVPIRKKGKLPGECVSCEFELEYGTAAFEMQRDSLKPGQKVIIIDDLLATGGTLEAAIKLVKMLNGQIESCIVIMELTDLNGRTKITEKLHSFIQY